ncbi:MAG: hypothetical protein GXX94_05360 [Chloroflexi bacterium]|nr:hypothetical protein [Chloroflexota bacterium]
MRRYVCYISALALLAAGLPGCGRATVAGDPTATAASVREQATVSVGVTAANEVPPAGQATAAPASTATTGLPGLEATPAVEAVSDLAGIELEGLPVALQIPRGWARLELEGGLLLAEDEACLTSAELECPALLVRRVPDASRPSEILAGYDLSGALSVREIPLVIAGGPVDAVEATLASDATGRIYYAVVAPVMLRGEALLFVASMPEGQAERAWPVLATILGSVVAAGG